MTVLVGKVPKFSSANATRAPQARHGIGHLLMTKMSSVLSAWTVGQNDVVFDRLKHRQNGGSNLKGRKRRLVWPIVQVAHPSRSP